MLKVGQGKAAFLFASAFQGLSPNSGRALWISDLNLLAVEEFCGHDTREMQGCGYGVMKNCVVTSSGRKSEIDLRIVGLRHEDGYGRVYKRGPSMALDGSRQRASARSLCFPRAGGCAAPTFCLSQCIANVGWPAVCGRLRIVATPAFNEFAEEASVRRWGKRRLRRRSCNSTAIAVACDRM